MAGYLTDIHITKGIVSPASSNNPTSPTTNTNKTNLLLNFTNGAIADATGRNVIETVADARTTSVVTKWTGSHSMSFDGTGDYIRSQSLSPYWNLTGNFTIEFWIYPLVSSNIDVIGTANNVAYIGSGQTGWVIAWTPSGLRFGYQSNYTWPVDSILSATTPIVNTWTHIAVVRNGSTLTGYISGTAGSTPATTSTAFISSLYGIHIGAGAGNQGSILNGYLSDIRVTNGYARYTANFTPPTSPPKLK
ncbi:MAG: LamG domain-containing protein [Betaproteobacteria bacterium]|nr:LamG domain-containing protein [Betaproteobacteria bacterium]